LSAIGRATGDATPAPHRVGAAARGVRTRALERGSALRTAGREIHGATPERHSGNADNRCVDTQALLRDATQRRAA